MVRKVKALVLLSGGLDSILAVKLLQEQGIKVTGISFKSYFFGTKNAEKAAKQLKIPLIKIDFSKKHFEIVKKPKHGYGKHMNPCIDCHGLMLREAGKVMRKKKFDFIATGEVLNERPMSQNRQALKLVEKLSKVEGKVLRPLSARKLKKTIPETKGLVNREKLEAISGRSRKRQLELVKKYKIKYFPSPAGGCLLTDAEFSKKLKKIIKKKLTKSDFELLKIGRHFWHASTKIIIARNEEECKKFQKLASKKDVLLEPKDYPGPTTLVRGKITKAVTQKAAKLTKYYSTKTMKLKKVKIKILNTNKILEV